MYTSALLFFMPTPQPSPLSPLYSRSRGSFSQQSTRRYIHIYNVCLRDETTICTTLWNSTTTPERFFWRSNEKSPADDTVPLVVSQDTRYPAVGHGGAVPRSRITRQTKTTEAYKENVCLFHFVFLCGESKLQTLDLRRLSNRHRGST